MCKTISVCCSVLVFTTEDNLKKSTYVVSGATLIKHLILCAIVGAHPMKHGFFPVFHYVFTVTSIITIAGLTIYLLYINGTYNVENILEVSPVFTTFPHALIKLTALFLRKRQIYDLLERSRLYFWKIEENPDIKRALKNGEVLRKCFFYSVLFFLLSTIIKPIKGELAYKCYQPKWTPRFLLMLLQDYAAGGVLLTLCAHDIMIQSFLIFTKVQFIMLNIKLRNLFYVEKGETLDKNELHRRLKECVDHQIFLMDFMQRFKKTFSATIFLFVGNIILSLCMRVYILLSPNSNLAGKIEAVIHTFAGLNEIGCCYSVPAQMLMDETDKVKLSLYLSDWYNYPEYNKDILQIFLREQKPLTITAGGIIMIDLKFFFVACKTIVSYSMFLNTMTQIQ